MRNTIITLVVLILIALGAWWYSNQERGTNGEYGQNSEGASGEVVVSITDAAANMQNVSEVTLTVEKAELYSDTRGWVTVDSSARDYKLLSLRDRARAELYAKANVAADTYSRVRMTVSKVEVEAKDGIKSSATLPSREIEFTSNVSVEADSSTEAKFDFLADKSLYTTAKGEYVFAPVISFESRSDASVEVDSQNAVITSGGSVTGTANVGMDLGGSMQTNFQLDTTTEIKIESGSIINLTGTTSTSGQGGVNLSL